MQGDKEEAQGVLSYVTEADDAGNAAAVRYRRIGGIRVDGGRIYQANDCHEVR